MSMRRPRHAPVRRLRRHTTTTAVLAALYLAAPAAAAAQLQYTIEAGVEHIDYGDYAAVPATTQTSLRTELGFLLTHDGPRLRANLHGRGAYRIYDTDAFDNAFDGTLAARMDWMLVPRRLSFTIEDALTVEPVDIFAVDTPDNRQEVNVFSAGPNLVFQLSEAVHGQVQLRVVDTRAEVASEFDSRRAILSAEASRDLSRASRLSVNALGERVSFDNPALAVEYDRTEAYARYETVRGRFNLALDAGYSGLDYHERGYRGQSEPLLRGEAGWRINPQHSVLLALAREMSDLATESLTLVRPGTGVPGEVPVGNSIVDASVYQERRASFEYQYSGARSHLVAATYAGERDYLQSPQFDQRAEGVRFELLYRASPRLTATAHGSWDSARYRNLDREDRSWRYGGNLTFHWSRYWAARLEAARYERESSDIGQDGQQTIVYLSVVYTR